MCHIYINCSIGSNTKYNILKTLLKATYESIEQEFNYKIVKIICEEWEW